MTGIAQLCPGCKLEHFRRSLPEKRSYTRGPRVETTLKLCANLRAYGRKVGVECNHFKGFSMDRFLGSRKHRRRR